MHDKYRYTFLAKWPDGSTSIFQDKPDQFNHYKNQYVIEMFDDTNKELRDILHGRRVKRQEEGMSSTNKKIEELLNEPFFDLQGLAKQPVPAKIMRHIEPISGKLVFVTGRHTSLLPPVGKSRCIRKYDRLSSDKDQVLAAALVGKSAFAQSYPAILEGDAYRSWTFNDYAYFLAHTANVNQRVSVCSPWSESFMAAACLDMFGEEQDALRTMLNNELANVQCKLLLDPHPVIIAHSGMMGDGEDDYLERTLAKVFIGHGISSTQPFTYYEVVKHPDDHEKIYCDYAGPGWAVSIVETKTGKKQGGILLSREGLFLVSPLCQRVGQGGKLSTRQTNTVDNKRTLLEWVGGSLLNKWGSAQVMRYTPNNQVAGRDLVIDKSLRKAACVILSTALHYADKNSKDTICCCQKRGNNKGQYTPEDFVVREKFGAYYIAPAKCNGELQRQQSVCMMFDIAEVCSWPDRCDRRHHSYGTLVRDKSLRLLYDAAINLHALKESL